jgi:CRP-like cAMP-binding protein
VSFCEPNAKLVGERLVNLGYGEQPVGWTFRIGLPHETPPAAARAALLAAARSTPGLAPSPEPQVFLESFGESAVTYRLRAWTHDVGALLRFTDAIHGRIWYQLQRAGIAIPYPVRTVQMHDAAGEAGRRATVELERRRARLDALELFAPLAPEQRERLSGAAVQLHFDHGEELVREGEAGDSLFLVAAGEVRVTRAPEGDDAQPLLLATLGAGDCFGEMSLLTGEPRSATVTAEGGCEVLRLDQAAMAPILAADPAVAEALSLLLADREAATRARLDDRRGRAALAGEGPDHTPLLDRIRAFFRL